MSKQFKIDFAWIPRDFGDPVDRHSLARISIEVGGISATNVEDLHAKTVRSDIRVSAFDFAAWLVANWWRLRWEADSGGHANGRSVSWDMSHKVGAAGNGYLWPDMEFSGSGDRVHVRARQTGAGLGHSLRFLNEIDVHVPADDFESGVQGFVDAVVSRMGSLSGASERSRELEAAWHELREEICDPARSLTRAMEARMGFDPEEADPAMLNRLREAATLVGRGAIEELASSSKRNVLEDFERIQRKFAESSTTPSLSISSTIRNAAVDAKGHGRQPWEDAEAVAGTARREWSLGADRIDSRRLAELCGVPVSWIREPSGIDQIPIPAGLRADDDPGVVKAILKKRHPNARRFALARIIGDHLVTADNEGLLPVTNAATDRQRFQRAFAQAFLCPFEALRDFLGGEEPDDDLMEEAAHRFEVSETAIRSILVNKGMLERERLPA